MKKNTIIMICSALVLSVTSGMFVYATNNNENQNKPQENSEHKKLTFSIDKSNYTRKITRLEFAQLSYDTLTYAGLSSNSNASYFADTDSKAVSALFDLNIINGKSFDKFAPDELLTREEAAAIIYRICRFAGLEDVYENRMLSSYYYIDTSDFNDWSADAIYNLKFHHIMEGSGEDKFSPKDNYTVGEAITTLTRLYDKISPILEISLTSDNTFADNLNSYMPDDKNYMVSPLSVKMALALAANGADGSTKSEILNAVGIDNLDAFNQNAKNMIKKYSKTDILKLSIANSIWLNSSGTGQNFSENYKNTVFDYFNGTANSVNNSNAVQEINNWTNEMTNGKIQKIIDSPDFDAALINAIYFKGAWLNDFSEYATHKDTFNSRNGKKTEIDFMNQTLNLPYAYTDSVHIAELKYKNSSDKFSEDGQFLETEYLDNIDVSMYLLMPDEDKKINPYELIMKCKKNNLFNSVRTDFTMPKFKIEYSCTLNDCLNSMGIKTAFTDSADFAPMFDKDTMKIDTVIHKTFIDVDEKGTEAAAVTAVMMECTSALIQSDPFVLTLDKPFSFVIMDNKNNEVFFIGEYAFTD